MASGPPVYRGDFPDPHVIRVKTRYYAYGTQTGGMNVQVMRSADLTEWEHLGDALPELPEWAGPGRTWSPSVLPRNGKYVLYVVVRDLRSDRQAIAVATAERPRGPFQPDGDGPFIFQLERGGSIDPSPFVDEDGTAYLFWKSDDNALGRRSSLWAQPLSPDGLGLEGSPTKVLGYDRAWEDPLIEAPAVVLHDGVYILFYSGNWWESDGYGIGYAVAGHPLGPFTKVTTEGPWVSAGRDNPGPGGQEFFYTAFGELRMAYHAWTPGSVGYAFGGARTLHIVGVDFVDDRPVLSSTRSTSTSSSPSSTSSSTPRKGAR